MNKLPALLLAAALCAPAEAAIYIVRHAEKKNPKQETSLISRKGKKRAASLVKVLSSTKLKAAYCTEFARTCQTAAPTAADHGLSPTVINSEDLGGLVGALRARAPEDDVLVVGHSDTIPDLLKALGVETPVTIGPNDYDNLFIVTLKDNDPTEFLWLHY